MIATEKQWLSPVPWDKVISINESLCQTQTVIPQNNARSYDSVRQMWEDAVSQRHTLRAALDLCRKCHNLNPFIFNNGNTFGAVARTILDDWAAQFPQVEATIIRNTASHYVVGLIDLKELTRVMRHFQKRTESAVVAKPAPEPAPAKALPAVPPKPSLQSGTV